MRRAVEGWIDGVGIGASGGADSDRHAALRLDGGSKTRGAPACVARGRTWQDRGVTDQEARYDRIAEGYAAWWAPVHRPGTLALLDEVEADVAAGARRLLDVGCGTGAMACRCGPSLAGRRARRGRRVGGDARARGG